MPGLLRGVVRTAAVAGTATAVSNRVSRRQAERWADQGQGYSPARVAPQETSPPPPSAPAEVDPIERLKELGQLHDSGVLTDEEFAAQKAKVLG